MTELVSNILRLLLAFIIFPISPSVCHNVPDVILKLVASTQTTEFGKIKHKAITFQTVE